ncbi:helix-turn-helix domain-containing protein [Luteibaculum oceani]|uniref:helix-turn-helix domain-containing protein n=1 Tax=Luteibaculum oceani TaxID=1294296 RepID=UPI001CB98022|nr:helix-turn-helix transcriptional regulator [Luteibaculum oceani]
MAERLAETERIFLKRRIDLIKKRLKSYGLTQQDLGLVLGHPSKSYISELVNGVSPFTIKDLIILHHVLKIDLADLIPTVLPMENRKKIQESLSQLKSKNPKLKAADFEAI